MASRHDLVLMEFCARADANPDIENASDDEVIQLLAAAAVKHRARLTTKQLVRMLVKARETIAKRRERAGTAKVKRRPSDFQNLREHMRRQETTR